MTCSYQGYPYCSQHQPPVIRCITSFRAFDLERKLLCLSCKLHCNRISLRLWMGTYRMGLHKVNQAFQITFSRLIGHHAILQQDNSVLYISRGKLHNCGRWALAATEIAVRAVLPTYCFFMTYKRLAWASFSNSGLQYSLYQFTLTVAERYALIRLVYKYKAPKQHRHLECSGDSGT